MLKAPTYISYNTKPSTECTIQDKVCYYCSLSPQYFKYILHKTLIHRHSHIFSLTHTWTHTHHTNIYTQQNCIYVFEPPPVSSFGCCVSFESSLFKKSSSWKPSDPRLSPPFLFFSISLLFSYLYSNLAFTPCLLMHSIYQTLIWIMK